MLVKQKQEENAHFPKVFCRVDTHEHWDPGRVVLGVHTHHTGASGREWARRDPLEGRREPPEQLGADLSGGLAGREAADGTGAAAVCGLGCPQPWAGDGLAAGDGREGGMCVGPGQRVCFSQAASRGEEGPTGKKGSVAGNEGGSR